MADGLRHWSLAKLNMVLINVTNHRSLEGITAAAIHGNKSQGARTKALADFKGSEIRILVATDIAARGLDIEQLPHVVNFDLPHVSEDYVHRIGRTGRAGLLVKLSRWSAPMKWICCQTLSVSRRRY